MNAIRLRIAGVLTWLFGLYNIERLHEPINLASFTYIFVAVVAIAGLFVPLLRTLPFGRVAPITCALFVLIKAVSGYELFGAGLPLTITELSVVCITLALARDIGNALSRVEEAVAAAMVDRLRASAVPFDVGQAAIYREIRRARRYRRPLSLLAIATPNGDFRAQVDRIVEAIQRENASNYVSGRIAELIGQETKDCDIVTQRSDHFVVGLPEVDGDHARALADRLTEAIEQQLGFKVRVGAASFPDEEVTFDQLLTRAEQAMRSESADTPPAAPSTDTPENGHRPAAGTPSATPASSASPEQPASPGNGSADRPRARPAA